MLNHNDILLNSYREVTDKLLKGCCYRIDITPISLYRKLLHWKLAS